MDKVKKEKETNWYQKLDAKVINVQGWTQTFNTVSKRWSLHLMLFTAQKIVVDKMISLCRFTHDDDEKKNWCKTMSRFSWSPNLIIIVGEDNNGQKRCRKTFFQHNQNQTIRSFNTLNWYRYTLLITAFILYIRYSWFSEG
jgi:hypothetical protein